MSDLKDLVDISKYAGERFDLIQAGGGNSSVKLDNGQMIIKASGYLLSDMTEINGYSTVETKKISCIAETENIINQKDKRKREHLTNLMINAATIDKENRPSIETILHSFLYKYTLHTHPIVVNIITIQKQWKEILFKIFDEEEIALVSYKTPGIELGLELKRVLKSFDSMPKIIFLQNHGLIISSNDKADIENLNEKVLDKIEKYLDIDMRKYKLTNKISNILKSIEKKSKNISYLSDDNYLNEKVKKDKSLFFKAPFCPDGLVFCGTSAVEITNLSDSKEIKSYEKRFFELPKVIIYNNYIFFIAPNIKKAKEIEEVMKFHIIVLENSVDKDINFLDTEEIAYLNNWEAEKFRQKL